MMCLRRMSDELGGERYIWAYMAFWIWVGLCRSIESRWHDELLCLFMLP